QTVNSAATFTSIAYRTAAIAAHTNDPPNEAASATPAAIPSGAAIQPRGETKPTMQAAAMSGGYAAWAPVQPMIAPTSPLSSAAPRATIATAKPRMLPCSTNRTTISLTTAIEGSTVTRGLRTPVR